MADLKSEKIANEIVRLENLLPGLQIEKEKAEAELADIYGKKLAGVLISKAELVSADSKLNLAEREPRFCAVAIKKFTKDLPEAILEERAALKLRRESLRPGAIQLRETLRKKIGVLILEAQVLKNHLCGDSGNVDLLSAVSHFFDGHFPDGESHKSELNNLVDKSWDNSKTAIRDSIIGQEIELDRLIGLNETKNINIEVEEILTRAREQAMQAQILG